ncbi:MAG: dihydrofolate reductase family protein [Bacteroidota bacterium]
MRKIIYYVASSLDGYITGPNEDVSGFVSSGNGVAQYQADLQDFETVIMGRKTYEFGYRFGLQAGQAPYPHMQHYIFSDTLSFAEPNDQVVVKKLDIEAVLDIKQHAKTDIYLCGGGLFAGWLLEQELIDGLKLKINPLILGQGVKLFGDSSKQFRLKLEASERYEAGLLINTYTIQY